MLRRLSNDYYYEKVGFQDYRIQRKIILDKIDEEYNGMQGMDQPQTESDKTSILMQTISFFRNSDRN
jgi:hypothetical protein